MLLQGGRPVAYYSRKLSGPELNYSVSDIEMLAVVASLKEWRCYLEGRPFTIVTDHKPNTYLDVATNAHTVKRRAHWLDISCGYDYTWVYRPGRLNVADPISRAPQHYRDNVAGPSIVQLVSAVRPARPCIANDCQRVLASTPPTAGGISDHSCGDTHPSTAHAVDVSMPDLISRRDAGHTRHPAGTAVSAGGSDTPGLIDVAADPCVMHWLQPAVLSVCVPSDSTASRCMATGSGAETLGYFSNDFWDRVVAGYAAEPDVSAVKPAWNLVHDEAGLQWTHDGRLYVPDHESLRFECYEASHAHPYSGHYGNQRTIVKVQQSFFWPGLAKDVRRWIKSCDSCQRVKALHASPMGKLQPLPIPGRRWSSVSMDFITDLPVTVQGHDAIWVVVDRLSKMVHLVAIKKSITAEQVAKVYEREVIRLHGVPDDIVSDRDVRFMSHFWAALHDAFGTKRNMSTKNHPQTDGQTENANGVLEDTLRHFVGPFQDDWDDKLAVAEFAMNNAWNSSIQNTPFMLNYGQNPDDPTIHFLRQRNKSVNALVGRWSEQLAKAKECLQAAQDRQKAAANKHRRDAPDYQPGDEVLLHTSYFKLAAGKSRKLAPRWVGPFKIVKAVGKAKLAYQIELPDVVRNMHPVFHVSALRPYNRSGSYQPPPLPVFIDGQPEYEVDYISDTRYSGKRRQYRMHWLGMQDKDTWEPVRHLVNCPEKIREFWAFRKESCPHALDPVSTLPVDEELHPD